MRSKVDPRLLIVLGIALVALIGFGALQVLSGGDEPAQSGETPPDASGSPLAPPPEEPPAESASVVVEGENDQSDWVAQANLICTQGARELQIDATAVSPEALAGALAQVRAEIEVLDALEPPADAEPEAAEFASLMTSTLDATEALIVGGDELDLDALGSFVEEQTAASVRLAELAAVLGVEACVRGAAPPAEGAIPADVVLEDEHGSKGLADLRSALASNDSVVLVVYSPDSELDTRVVREARAGAKGGGAGFVAVNGTRENQVQLLAETFELRGTPTTLVVNPNLVVASRFVGFTDRETVAQAVRDSLGSSTGS